MELSTVVYTFFSLLDHLSRPENAYRATFFGFFKNNVARGGYFSQ